MREEAIDRISSLPDSLLHHIHSFLQIEDGARTSILSKRWKYIWITVPTLHLQTTKYISDHSQVEKFMDFVDGTLFRHASNVDKFLLPWDIALNEYRVHSWISFVVRGNVKELDLYLYQEHPLFLPLSLFTCESLISLVLRTHPYVRLPKHISFPRLKRLELYHFKLTDECWNEELFSNSPVLEELILDFCSVSMSSFCILIPTLKLLKINTWIAGGNTVRDCAVKIHAPRLAAFSYAGYMPKEFILGSFLALVEATIDFYSGEKAVTETSRLLRALAHVKCLTVYNTTLEVFCSAYYVLNNLPTFHNVKALNIAEALSGDEGLIALLKALPNLESLVFDNLMIDKVEEAEDSDDVEGEDNHGIAEKEDVSDVAECGKIDEDENNYANEDDCWALNIATTEYLLPHLKSVRFQEFVGNPREMRWVKLILRNAKALQTMTIRYYYSDLRFLNVKTEKEAMAEIPNLRRASAGCVIKFCA